MNLYLVAILLLCICFSGLMLYRSKKEERAIEEAFIEKEGQIYMKRMEEEKAERHKLRA